MLSQSCVENWYTVGARNRLSWEHRFTCVCMSEARDCWLLLDSCWFLYGAMGWLPPCLWVAPAGTHYITLAMLGHIFHVFFHCFCSLNDMVSSNQLHILNLQVKSFQTRYGSSKSIKGKLHKWTFCRSGWNYPLPVLCQDLVFTFGLLCKLTCWGQVRWTLS